MMGIDTAESLPMHAGKEGKAPPTKQAEKESNPLLEGKLGSTAHAADYCSTTVRHLESLRIKGGGPRFVRLSGRCVRYAKNELDVWIAASLKSSTSQA